MEEEAYPVKQDEAEVPVTLEEEAYPVRLDKAVSSLVGRGLLECDPLVLQIFRRI